jgi:hypothetical protein
MAYEYCSFCGKAGIIRGAAPHNDEPCPQAVKESEARIAAALESAKAPVHYVQGKP